MYLNDMNNPVMDQEELEALKVFSEAACLSEVKCKECPYKLTNDPEDLTCLKTTAKRVLHKFAKYDLV